MNQFWFGKTAWCQTFTGIDAQRLSSGIGGSLTNSFEHHWASTIVCRSPEPR